MRERAAVLLRYHDLVLDRQGELLDLIQAENGKARVWAFEEIMDQAVTARYYARLAPRALKPHARLTARQPNLGDTQIRESSHNPLAFERSQKGKRCGLLEPIGQTISAAEVTDCGDR